jgi:hypothetical protein
MADKAMCDFCQALVEPTDFESGKAVKFLGRTYCQSCMEKSIKRSRSRDAAVADDLRTPKPRPLDPPGSIG